MSFGAWQTRKMIESNQMRFHKIRGLNHRPHNLYLHPVHASDITSIKYQIRDSSMHNNSSVKLLSHASILIETKGIKVLTDPWFFGTAFNDGWELSPLPDKAYVESLISDVDYIWISHEHPDHFHFPTLKWIISVVKKDVKIFFQDTNSEKVIDALTKIGFKNIEKMPHMKKIQVAPGLELACYAHRHLDSALAVFVNSNFWLLNINDTELNETDTSIIQGNWGSPCVIYNQFSYAGSDGIVDALALIAADVLNKMIDHHKQLNAQLTVPFASYVRFARRDNAYMNAHVNSPFDVEKKFRDNGLAFCLQSFSGEGLQWSNVNTLPDNLQEIHSQSSINLAQDHSRIALDEFDYKTIPREKVKSAIENRIRDWKNNTNSLVWRLLKLEPMRFNVTDWGDEIWVCDFNAQTFAASSDSSSTDIRIYSQPLNYAFETPFGIQTLGVSGRYRFSDDTYSVPKTWKLIRFISSLHNANIHLSLIGIFNAPTLRWIWQRRIGLLSQIKQQYSRFF